MCCEHILQGVWILAQRTPALGGGTRGMQTALWARKLRIRANKTAASVKATCGENPLLPYNVESRQEMDALYYLNSTVNVEPRVRNPKNS